MLKCKILDVQGFEPAIHGMRNPKNSWDKSDSWFCHDKNCLECESIGNCDGTDIGNNDMKLMKNLFDAGTEHRKYDRMIVVWCDITAPLYWWKEFSTYKVGTVENSCSTMHKIHSKEFTLDDFSDEYLFRDNSQWLQETCDRLNEAREDFLQTNEKCFWWQMIQMLPSSYNQKRTVMLNYEVVARIIEQRSHHKLDEWHQLIDVLGGLPYVQELMK